MQFKLKNQTLTITKNQFKFDDQSIDINDKTKKTLLLFLHSDNAVISKDMLLEQVWLGIIVSDASIFKQIQTLRNLLVQAGLPEDSIENIYGRGYRLKYSVTDTSEPTEGPPEPVDVLAQQPSNHRLKVSLVLGMIAAALGYFFWFQPNQLLDKLSTEQKTSITQLSKNDWQDGLDHINQLLAHARNSYSIADLAFLYQQKGLAEQQLQLIDESLVSLTQSLQYHQQQANQDGMGHAHLLLGRLYDYLDNAEKQQGHIEQAIALFKTVNNHTAEIDAYLELAYLQKKSGDIQAAIKTYQQSIGRAQQLKDQTGEMIGINNLAATYLIINDTDNALQLAEQGLAINLALGNGQNTANSYSFLSQLAQRQGDTGRAFKMLEQALKFQLETNSHKNLSPKVMTLNFLLLETHQYASLNDLLSLTDQYAKSLRIKGGSAIIDLYQGMAMAYQNQWPDALREFESAWQTATKKNFSYKKPLIQAFLALAHAQNNNHLKAIEFANSVSQDQQSSDREMNLSNLVKAISYAALEDDEMGQQWSVAAASSSRQEWPAELKIWLQLKQSKIPDDDIRELQSVQQQLTAVQQYMDELASNNSVDANLMRELQSQLKDLIEQRQDKSSEVTP